MTFSALTPPQQVPLLCDGVVGPVLPLDDACSDIVPLDSGGLTAAPVAMIDDNLVDAFLQAGATKTQSPGLRCSSTGILTTLSGETAGSCPPESLEALLRYGVLVETARHDGCRVLAIDSEKLHWSTPSRPYEGTLPLVAGIAGDPLFHGKLSCILDLCRTGWVPLTRPFPQFLPAGSKTFIKDLAKSRMYFVAMLDSQVIFDKMSHVADMVPQISHVMPQSYYTGLVKISSPTKIRKLMELALEHGSKKEELCAQIVGDDGFHHESCLVTRFFYTDLSIYV